MSVRISEDKRIDIRPSSGAMNAEVLYDLPDYKILRACSEGFVAGEEFRRVLT